MLLMMVKIVYSSLREVYLKFYYDYDKDKYGNVPKLKSSLYLCCVASFRSVKPISI